MENKPYSFNNRLNRVSKVILSAIILVTFLGILLMAGSYNMYLQIWISNNTSSTNTTNPINPFNPTNPINPSTLDIPFLDIFSNNIIVILFIPLAFVSSINFIMIKTKRFLIRKEILTLYDFIGIKQTTLLNGLIELSSDRKLQISGTYNGVFKLESEDKVVTYVTGDELLWKIRYFTFIDSKNISSDFISS